MGLVDLRVLEQQKHVRRRVALPLEWAEGVHRGQKARAGALERLERLCAGDVGGLREPASTRDSEGTECRHELGAVDEREPFLRLQPDWLEADLRQRHGSGQAAAVDRRLALPDQRQREVREWREVAACADRAPARHVREDAAVEALDKQFDGFDPRSRVALRERVCAKEHRGTDDLVRVRLADPARMAPQQPQLQLLRQLLGDRARDEATEARVDAVRVLFATVRGVLDDLARRGHSLPGRVGEADRPPAECDFPDVVQNEIVARQRPALDHAASVSRTRGTSLRRERPSVRFARPPPRGERTDEVRACLCRIRAGIATRDVVRRTQSKSRSSSTREASKPSIRSDAPAAAAAAPAGISPTSSDPTTSAPRAAASVATRATISCSAAASQSSTFMLTCTSPADGRSSPSARTPAKPPPRSRTRAAISRAASSGPRRLTLNAISGLRTPTSTPPADSDSCRGPNSGAISPASTRRCSSRGPPRRKNAGPRPSQRSPYRNTGSESSSPTRRPSSRAASRAASAPSGTSGTRGTTSAAPIRGWAPSCRRRSMRSAAHAIPASSASTSASADPTSVNTERLWSVSAWTSSSRARDPSASASASIVARSRPSEKFGTDSSGRTTRVV